MGSFSSAYRSKYSWLHFWWYDYFCQYNNFVSLRKRNDIFRQVFLLNSYRRIISKKNQPRRDFSVSRRFVHLSNVLDNFIQIAYWSRCMYTSLCFLKKQKIHNVKSSFQIHNRFIHCLHFSFGIWFDNFKSKWCWWHRYVGDLKLVTILECW